MSIFTWICYVPWTELNSAVIVCSSNSYLVDDYNGKCHQKDKVFIILVGVLGLMMTFFTGTLNFLCFF